MSGNTYNYAVTISDTSILGYNPPYKRTVKASTIKPGNAVKKVLRQIEKEDNHWLWKTRSLRIEVERVS